MNARDLIEQVAAGADPRAVLEAEKVWPKDLPNDKPTWTHDPVGQRLVAVFHHAGTPYRIQSSAQDRSHPGAEEGKLVFAMRDALMKMLNGQSRALVKVSHDLWQLP